MRIVIRSDFDVPEWRVTGFSNSHNHELLKSIKVQLLPSQSTISADDKSRICMYAKAGMSARHMMGLMELEKGVKLGCLPFTELDIRNLLQSFKHVDKDNEAIDLVSKCKRLKDENSDFKYDFKLDGNNILEHIAWSYPSSIQQYETLGHVIILDTTHRIDVYDMIFGLWIGVDNHGLACLYSCVLLREENQQSFTWASKTFLCFTKSKVPQTILTDQNMWLKEAIACEMPETKHAFCICLELVVEFEAGWKDMVDRCYFFAGLMSKSVTDSTNAFIQRILSAQSKLSCVIDEVADIAEYNDLAGSKLKMQHKFQKVSLKTGSPIESHAATVLTPFAFSLLQEELVLAPQFASILVSEGCFHIRHHTEMDEGCKVMREPHQELIHCTAAAINLNFQASFVGTFYVSCQQTTAFTFPTLTCLRGGTLYRMSTLAKRK